MADVVFRAATPETPAPVKSAPQKVDVSSSSVTTDVPVPYLDYKNTNHKPFTVEYFELGNMWDDRDGGFTSELNIIENYMYHLIGNGKIANSTEAVSEKIKAMEKQAGITKYETTVSRLAKISAFTKFLQDTEHL